MPGSDKDTALSYHHQLLLYGKTAIYLGLGSSLAFGLYWMLKRYQTSADISERTIKAQKIFHGYVIDVSDGDTLRVYHTPFWGWFGTVPEKKRGLTKYTISVRLSAVDAPEVAHFGKPAQPLSAEAKELLARQVLGQRVSVKPLAKDQYGRLVASVTYRRLLGPRRDAAHEMLRAGMATIYRGGNAQYDGQLEKLEKIEAAAKKAKRGIWGLKKGQYESPAEYKRKHK
ncbi:putative endonuclease lcl3 [Coemansia aciculifera]|uniref:Endonuclease lcl3 n=1 Tax=Coemansia aciculifera TaxID=417176 RepID=A0A9W8IF62_9FUNG|nr:putative endonuclease lcl3 [Coemansia aciculifera]KAJ2871791.1 putative endonuclease lcl3 [Coemansia aciculifera]